MPLAPKSLAFILFGTGMIPGAIGCSSSPQDQSERDARTRDEVAKATERAKPAIEEAGRKLGEAAQDAAHQAKAAAQGVRDGWNNRQNPLVNVNSATESQLMELPGITKPEARKIIAGRPYRDAHDLLARDILSESAYDRIRGRITAK